MGTGESSPIPPHCTSNEWSPRSNPPDPKVPTTLPPEVLDKILEQIPVSGKGRRTLISCALVATWWTGPSQRCLFSSIEIDRRNYGRWMDGVVLSGSKAHLLEHVRSLQHGRTSSLGIKYRMRDLAQNAGGYLSDLRNIHTLTLSHIAVEHIGEGEFHTCFSAFRETLTHISFDSFTTSFSAFITLVGYFPNVTALHLRSFILKPDDGPVPPLSRPLQGKLHLYDVSPGNLMFFSRFAKLDLEYEELSIHVLPTLTGNGLVECALRIAPSTVKFLRLGPGLNCKWPLLMLLIEPASLLDAPTPKSMLRRQSATFDNSESWNW